MILKKNQKIESGLKRNGPLVEQKYRYYLKESKEEKDEDSEENGNKGEKRIKRKDEK